ncbi:cytochrome c oxidase subunit 5C [Coffea arabica]|uniref:Cytochrome c oxidase subunit 5C n=1 Tax=Coffea arabica TaxID=13443 RepID=A0A6P6T7I2_COFAR|nr:cytochrome c oxidase subunit 5C-like [Coffea arabica]
MAAQRIGHVANKGPSVFKAIVLGMSFGVMAGGLWKMHHRNNQRRTKEFYDMLEKDEISVVVVEE